MTLIKVMEGYFRKDLIELEYKNLRCADRDVILTAVILDYQCLCCGVCG